MYVLVIGGSTGAPDVIREILGNLLVVDGLSVIIVQHISSGFLDVLKHVISSFGKYDIIDACPGGFFEPGKCYIAPEDIIISCGPGGLIEEFSGDGNNPIDMLMSSVSEQFKEKSIGVILSGMGNDGVAGIGDIKSAGGLAIAQDEASSVIYGMNKIAVQCKYIDKILPPREIASEIIKYLKIKRGCV